MNVNIENSSRAIPFYSALFPPPVSKVIPEDRDLVAAFLQSRNLTSADTVYQSVTDKLKQLKRLEEELRANIDSLTDANWTNIEVQIDTLSRELHILLSQYNSTKKRKRKNKKTNSTSRQELHKIINDWQLKVQEKAITEEKTKQRKLNIANHLKNVNRRIEDAKEMIRKLELVMQLRHSRGQNLTSISVENKTLFSAKINAMYSVWKNLLDEYKEERNALQMDENELNPEHIKKLWKECVFGDVTEIKWSRKEQINFTKNRESWTEYISSGDPNSTPILNFPILPTINTCDQWKYYQIQPHN